MKTRLFFIVLAHTCWLFPELAVSQNERIPEQPKSSQRWIRQKDPIHQKESDRDREYREFVESALERNMDQLFDAISEFDQDFNQIVRSGMSGRAFGRRNTVVIQVLCDVRVIRLREFLAALPKEESAERIKQVFSKKFQAFEDGVDESFEPDRKKWTPGSFYMPAAAHGIAATLYLSSEFCDHNTFEEQYRKWLHWYRRERTKRASETDLARENLKKQLISQKELSFAVHYLWELESYGCPDRLFFINLCGIRAIRRGVKFEVLEQRLAELNADLEIEIPHFTLYETNRFDPVTNTARPEKISFPIISGYGEATRLDDTMEWSAKDVKTLQYRNDQATLIALEWSQPALIGKWSRELQKSLKTWSSETYGWPDSKKRDNENN